LSQLSTGLTDEEKHRAGGVAHQRLHDDDEIMTLKEWFRRNTLSRATGQRLIASGKGPDITWLSPNRRGVSYGADRRWKAARTVSTTA
jgi:hypothetical protein